MTVNLLDTPIEFLKGVGPKKAELFKKEFEIFTYNDLLQYYPYRHVDKSKIYQIKDIQSDGSYLQFSGRITSYEVLGEKFSKRLVAQFQDETGKLELVWFNSIKWVEDLLKERRNFIVFGKPSQFNHKWQITHPDLLDPQGLSEFGIPKIVFIIEKSRTTATINGSRITPKVAIAIICFFFSISLFSANRRCGCAKIVSPNANTI